jgi:hypothetical protein
MSDFHLEFLRKELARRQAKNPSYSLRAFANHLDLHASALSRILNQKQELSLNSCKTILARLRFEEHEKAAFIESVVARRAKQIQTQLSPEVA